MRAPRGETVELIVNADDFGMSASVNRGIITAHEQGIVTSCSLMVRREAASAAAAYARTHGALSVGLHIDLGEWVRGDQDWEPRYIVVELDNPTAVADEVDRQLQTFRELLDRDPTHLDSHQHVHRNDPVRSVGLETAGRYGIPLRHFSDFRYCGQFYGQHKDGGQNHAAITVERLIDLIDALLPGVTELCCHPAEEEQPGEPYGAARAKELATLCDPRVRSALEERGILLRSFNGISREDGVPWHANKN